MNKVHIAIMRKSWGLMEKIANGEKTIESRWYKNRSKPWNKIESDETIYFKNSGQPVKLKAKVEKVLQFDDLNPRKVKKILRKYGEADGLTKKDLNDYYQLFKNKKYCLLIFLKSIKEIKPFAINKKGFGIMAAWITTDNINKIRKT